MTSWFGECGTLCHLPQGMATHPSSDCHFQKMPAVPLFLAPSLFADFSRASGSFVIKVPLAPPLEASGSHFLWEKEIQADLGNAFCRGSWHHVQVGKVIFNWLYLQFHSLVPSPAPPAIPFPRQQPVLHHWACVAPAHPAPAVQLWSGPQAIFCLVPKIIQLSGMCV